MNRGLAVAALLCFVACGSDSNPAASDGGEAFSQLAALGYVEWTPIDPGETGKAPAGGVVSHDPTRAQPGLNLYTSRALAGAWLVDMRGVVVHSWHAPGGAPGWNHAEWAGRGELVVLSQKPSIQRIGRDSKVLWELPLAVHHDVAIETNGSIHTLERAPTIVSRPAGSRHVVGENILTLSPEGAALSRTPLHDLLGDSIDSDHIDVSAAGTPDPRSFWQRLRAGFATLPADVLHANSLEILPRAVDGFGAAGDAFVSLRNLDLLAVVARDAQQVVWKFGPGSLARQHHASLLQSGNLLAFDNGRGGRPSRAVEIDPRTREIVWSYSGPPSEPLHSGSQGSAERLTNGNTLIVESERGRALEVTPDGEVVWEFFSPHVDAGRDARASIYRMTRLPESALASP